MTYRRIKTFTGPEGKLRSYVYEVRSERHGDRVDQIVVRYVGPTDEHQSPTFVGRRPRSGRGPGRKGVVPKRMHAGIEDAPGITPAEALAFRPDRLGAPGEGGTRSFYAFYYQLAPSYGIFDLAAKDAFARRHTETALREVGAYKKNVRAWVHAANDALASGDRYRIAETAREVPFEQGEIYHVGELEGIQQHLGQANIAGQRAGQHLKLGKNREFERDRQEFASIVATIDAQTSSWESEPDIQ